MDDPFNSVYKDNLSPSPDKKSHEGNKTSEPEGYETAQEETPYGTPEGTPEKEERIEVVVRKSP